MKMTLTTLSFALGLLTTSTAFAEEKSPHKISGNIGVVSQYVLRGNTVSLENEDAAVQGGLDYSHASGFYVGYWGSTLGYSLDNSGRKAFEHDFYLGYNGTINQDLGYTLGATYYLYAESDQKSDFPESIVGINYKDFSLTAQTVLHDSIFGNTGDTYILAGYSYALPKDFSLNTALGLYYNNDSGEFEGDLYQTTEDFNFRHFNIGLSHPLGNTGATVAMDFIVGGKLRDDSSLKNKLVLGVKYEF